jgi:hypothetical protein
MKSFFQEGAAEARNVGVIVAGFERRGIPVETEVEVMMHGLSGRIDVVADFDGHVYGWEVKKYELGGPRLLADGIAQAASYAKAKVCSGRWFGRTFDFVFVGPAPNEEVQGYCFVHAEMLSRYTAPQGVGIFDQRMCTYAFGQPAIRFDSAGYRFVQNFNHVRKHRAVFSR